MRCVEIALLLLSCVGVVVCADQKAYVDHVKTLKRFRCADPQPRVFELEEVIAADILKEKTHGYRQWVKPAVTVLHRCYSTGCCKKPNQRCVPAAADDVKLTFGIFGSSLEYIEVEAVNHTQCVCA